ncbi:MAG: transglycosylase domain-containing protein, partial [Afipia sp.]|nr:transglycosylase domain-containing protein [Afipia sp.]
MRRLIRIVVLVVLGLLLLPYVLTPLYSTGHPISTLMIGRYLTGESVTRKWVDLDQMSEALPRSVVAAEDARFCFHHGIDWNSVRNIIED